MRKSVGSSRSIKHGDFQPSRGLKLFPKPLLETIIRRAAYQRFVKNSMVLQERVNPSQLFIIESGSVSVSQIRVNGRQHITAFLQSGDLFDPVAILDGQGSMASYIARMEVGVWVLTRQQIEDLSSRYPTFHQTLHRVIYAQSREMMSMIEDLSTRSVQERLARFLLRLTRYDSILTETITREEMACHLGTAREVVSRTLKCLQNEGAIDIDARQIRIVNQQTLTHLANV